MLAYPIFSLAICFHMRKENKLAPLNLNNNMSSAIVWFNGPSVKQFYNIPPHPLEVGCNFILDHRKVHHICCYDQPAMKILEKTPVEGVKYWTRRIFGGPFWTAFKSNINHKKYRNISGYCSGTLALTLAVHLGAKKIYLLGCDWSLTNASVYDKQYKWRKFQPNKTSKDKFQLIELISDLTELVIVHNTKRELGPNVKWITPEEFAEGH